MRGLVCELEEGRGHGRVVRKGQEVPAIPGLGPEG